MNAQERKKAFEAWFATTPSRDGSPLGEERRKQYVNELQQLSHFGVKKGFFIKDIFEVSNVDEAEEMRKRIKAYDELSTLNDKLHNGAPHACLKNYYIEFLKNEIVSEKINSNNDNDIIKFKKLLSWFVERLNINIALKGKKGEGSIYGHGYKGDKEICAAYKNFSKYNGFEINVTLMPGIGVYNVNGSTQVRSNYINKKNTDINVYPIFSKDKKRVESLELAVKSKNIWGSKKTVDELAVLEDTPPNSELQAFFEEFENLIKKYDSADDNNSANGVAEKNTCIFAKNMILYGPPGTGKTYSTAIYAVAVAYGRSLADVESDGYDNILRRYDELKADGRIAFTTFHQSYGYEEFIEGIRPKLADGGIGDISYEIHSGVFKSFCDKAKKAFFIGHGAVDNFDESYDKLRALFNTPDDAVVVPLISGKGTFKISQQLRGDGLITKRENNDNYNYPKEQLYEVYKTNVGKPISLLGYMKGIIQYMKANCELKDYVPASNTNADNKSQNYVFIIDEINRGNISKIFGELITLIEDTKRLGAKEACTATLPYSNEPFGVPNNVYIIGTMNTADRSIALMDTALRRRFSFKEMLPSEKVLKEMNIKVGSIDIAQMLSVMNSRIAALYDREHTIGHSYFIPLRYNPSIEKLADIFMNKVIPLLQEYFYDDYEKIRLILGDNQKDSDDICFCVEVKNIARDLFGDKKIPDQYLYMPVAYRINDKSAFLNIGAYEYLK